MIGRLYKGLCDIHYYMESKLLTLAVIVAMIGAVAVAGTLTMTAFANKGGIPNSHANAKAKGSNKAFGQCIKNLPVNASLSACNDLKRGHKFTTQVKGNETG
jgi:hypothetical protein